EGITIEQADISFGAGMKKVVGCIQEMAEKEIGLYGQGNYWAIPEQGWQAKLKEWGVDA
ncbi:unnamed protein product, partial [marine sediment metagenome]